MILNSPYVSGSLTVTGNIIASGSITLSGSVASASYAANAELLDGKNSSEFTTTASFNSYTASNDASVLSATMATVTNAAAIAALTAKTSSYATTGSNTLTGTQYISNTNDAIGFSNTTSSLYTDGGLQVTKNAYFSSSMFIKGNLTVFGTQSVNFITSSQLNISTNIITVNTSTPSVRFGGLAVQDSGSTGLTGSILWDSQDNQWIYTNPSGSEYDSAMFLVGPRNSGSLGNEVGITTNALAKGNGAHHMTSSGIFESGSGNVGIGTSIPAYKLDVNGTGRFTSTLLVSGAATFSSSITAEGNVTINAGNGNQLSLNNAGERFTQINLNNNSVGKALIWWDNTNTELVLLASGSGTGHLKIASTGVATFSNNIITTGATAEIMANGAGSSNTVGGSSRFTILDSSNSRGWILQQNASYNLSFWHNNSGWSNVINFTPAGAATFSSTVDGTIFNSTSNAFRFSGNNAISLVSLNAQNVVKINAAGYWGTQLVGANDQGILINNSGNVGIGTTSPDAGLTVETNSGLLNGISIRSTLAFSSSPDVAIAFRTKFNSAGNYSTNGIIVGYKDNATDGNQQGGLQFYTNAGSGIAEKMRITSGGLVGIGVTDPSVTFNVGHSAHGIGVAYRGSSALPAIAGLFTDTGVSGGGSGYGDLLVKARTDYGGFYGINFFTAAADNTPVLRLRIASNGVLVNQGGIYDTSSGVVWIARQGGNDRIIANGNGYVFMPFLTTGSGIDDLGWWSTSGTSWTYNGMLMRISSSARYKKNIRNIEIDTAKIFELNTISYENNENTAVDGLTSFGLLAEDVAEKIPLLATYNNEGQPEGVQYKMLSVLLLEEMKKLKAQNDDLQQQINELKA